MASLVKAVESEQDMEAAYALRFQVVVKEQGVPADLERDSLDQLAFHAVAIGEGKVVGTGRLIVDPPSQGVIGRMAIEAPQRRQGIGGRVLSFLEEAARSRGVRRVTLHAQIYVTEFYVRRGYQEEGPPFMEAGIQHIQMFKQLG